MLDVVFPITCIGCGADGAWLCDRCVGAQEHIPQRCIGCGDRSLHGVTCAACRKAGFRLEGVVTVGSYGNDLFRQSIHALKFQGVRDLATPLGTLLSRSIGKAIGSSLAAYTLVPLPLHPQRERWRGYNQSLLLAEGIGQRVNRPVVECLTRTYSSAPQSTIDTINRAARLENVADAFTVRQDVEVPSHCLLIDDVVTTGATLEAAARVLYDHGAQHVWGAVICKG